MKKITVIIVLIFAGITGYSQIYVGDVNINKKQGLTYVDLVGVTKNYEISVYVDYGQNKPKVEEIRDKNGTIARSNNIISALNLFAKNGWVLEKTLAFGSNGENTIRYTLKKDKSK